MKNSENRIKRGSDLVIGSPLFFVSSPLIVFLAGLVRIFLGTPVFFKQRRPGLQGRPFTLYKFRTMTDDRNQDGTLKSDAERLTGFGEFLRSTSLDELPEIYNVVAGSMSLVGPRPLLLQYLERYSPEQARRHEVKPGITGWAQIHGRNALKWEEKFRLDVWYVDHWTLALDLKILAKTAGQVLQRKGISQPGHKTAVEFMGNSNDER